MFTHIESNIVTKNQVFTEVEEQQHGQRRKCLRLLLQSSAVLGK